MSAHEEKEERMASEESQKLCRDWWTKSFPPALHVVLFKPTSCSLYVPPCPLWLILPLSLVSLPGGWVPWPRVKVSNTHSTTVHPALGKLGHAAQETERETEDGLRERELRTKWKIDRRKEKWIKERDKNYCWVRLTVSGVTHSHTGLSRLPTKTPSPSLHPIISQIPLHILAFSSLGCTSLSLMSLALVR